MSVLVNFIKENISMDRKKFVLNSEERDYNCTIAAGLDNRLGEHTVFLCMYVHYRCRWVGCVRQGIATTTIE
jgi:hypothetical protein